MKSRIRCFLLTPTNRVTLRLRRFTFSDSKNLCSAGPMNGHDSGNPFPMDDGTPTWPARMSPEGYYESYEDVGPPHDDPRWPTVCEQCGCALPADTIFQVFLDPVYRRADTGEEVSLRSAPPGAMYWADWHSGTAPHLHVVLPPNGGYDYWDVDGPAKSGGKWTRTGEPPDVTASPSILTPHYHGFLRAGWLEEC
jgi:hypothetical protein